MSVAGKVVPRNNFDIVRLLLAVVVVLVHSEDLSGSPALGLWRTLFNSHLAVECFFVISGYLIFASYERALSPRQYFVNRGWRILPGYWVSTLLCLLIAVAYRSFHVGWFLVCNLLFVNFLHPGIAGVFENNPGNHALNGALWTIKVEVMFYIAVPAIVWLCRRVPRRLGRDAVLWGLMAASIVFRQAAVVHHESLAVQLPGQLSFFMAGALVYYHQDFFRRHGKALMLAAALLYAVHTWTGIYAFRPLAVGALTLGACLLLPPFQGPTRWGDFSYGTYILHYPILQVLVAAGWFALHPWGTQLLAVVLIAAGAVLSWRLVEKPSLAHAKSRGMRRKAANYPPAVP